MSYQYRQTEVLPSAVGEQLQVEITFLGAQNGYIMYIYVYIYIYIYIQYCFHFDFQYATLV